ncbi:ribonuclease HI [Desulfobaculum bizertense]|uniref:Ribonuclease H n=1 Tax=Desulfobaculum bizertense DSM 18034 TaxID=1121442 RepID=A0A1T4VFU8_9BACT|nr:ribonuclease HI [Desulfobaculum bizertense]SKA63829.1 RNase HI [Desulfobaculum bizertense DSM 18034]
MSDKTIIHTDGSALGNPGPGGWGAVLRYKDNYKEISGGFKNTTNNRMELTAVIEALQALTRPCDVVLYSDSKYFLDAIRKGWLKNWLKNGWKTAGKKPVKNKDLWQKIIPLIEKHSIQYEWVKGHSGNPDNERCDILAKEAAQLPGLPKDPGFTE